MNRQSIRLRGYDYSQAGAYFITLCIENREYLLGDVVDGVMQLNDFGKVIVDSWLWLASRYVYVELDEYVVMPNHFHAVLVITDDGRNTVGAIRESPVHIIDGGKGGSRTAPTKKTLGRLIGAFKTVSTKKINQLRNTPAMPLWQRNYFERVVRDENELRLIREYIVNNPMRWQYDKLNGDNGRGDNTCRDEDLRRGGSRTAPTEIGRAWV